MTHSTNPHQWPHPDFDCSSELPRGLIFWNDVRKSFVSPDNNIVAAASHFGRIYFKTLNTRESFAFSCLYFWIVVVVVLLLSFPTTCSRIIGRYFCNLGPTFYGFLRWRFVGFRVVNLVGRCVGIFVLYIILRYYTWYSKLCHSHYTSWQLKLFIQQRIIFWPPIICMGKCLYGKQEYKANTNKKTEIFDKICGRKT